MSRYFPHTFNVSYSEVRYSLYYSEVRYYLYYVLFLVLLVTPLDGEKVHSRFLANVDAGHVKALPCPFQLIQLKPKLVVWAPGLKVWANSVQNYGFFKIQYELGLWYGHTAWVHHFFKLKD